MLERELFAILNNTADAAFTVDDGGLVRSWNSAAERLFGFSAAAALGHPCAELFQGRSSFGTLVCTEECEVRRCTAARREVPNFDLTVKVRSGERIWTNVSILAFHDNRTQRSLTVHLCRDISQQKKKVELTEKLLEIAKQLTHLADDDARLEPAPELTEQERNVLRLLSTGKTPREVTQELGISPRTLRNHIHHVDQKLHTRNRLEAVLQAIRRGLI